jgi:hypothetical protein
MNLHFFCDIIPAFEALLYLIIENMKLCFGTSLLLLDLPDELCLDFQSVLKQTGTCMHIDKENVVLYCNQKVWVFPRLQRLDLELEVVAGQ